MKYIYVVSEFTDLEHLREMYYPLLIAVMTGAIYASSIDNGSDDDQNEVHRQDLSQGRIALLNVVYHL